MSRSNQPPSDKLLLEAVELRAAGFKWETVAEKLGRAVETVRKWPMRYPDRWQSLIERAEERLTIDSNAESVVVLRNMLRDADVKMRWQAARTLVALRIDLGKLGLRLLAARNAVGRQTGPAEDPDYQFFRFMQTKSDQELARIAELIRPSQSEWAALGLNGQAGGGAEAGPDWTCDPTPPAHDRLDPATATRNT
jgi:hypothetical protein